jgi:hypothetical protein
VPLRAGVLPEQAVCLGAAIHGSQLGPRIRATTGEF